LLFATPLLYQKGSENVPIEAAALENLEAITTSIRHECCCKLGATRTNGVPGEGNEQAEIMFVGEAPGYHEDQQGKPFVGSAGQFLEEMLGTTGLKRSDVFITNVVKCRPPNNRDPEVEEKEACKPYLEAQIRIIDPTLIVCLGRHSMNYFLPGFKISQVHGQPKRRAGKVVMPLFHPAAALHNDGLRQTLLDDFAKIPAVISKIKSTEHEATPPDSKGDPSAQQLSLL